MKITQNLHPIKIHPPLKSNFPLRKSTPNSIAHINMQENESEQMSNYNCTTMKFYWIQKKAINFASSAQNYKIFIPQSFRDFFSHFSNRFFNQTRRFEKQSWFELEEREAEKKIFKENFYRSWWQEKMVYKLKSVKRINEKCCQSRFSECLERSTRKMSMREREINWVIKFFSHSFSRFYSPMNLCHIQAGVCFGHEKSNNNKKSHL